MTGYKDLGKKLKKYSKNGVFPICDPLIFLPIFVPLWCSNFMQNKYTMDPRIYFLIKSNKDYIKMY